MFDCLSSTFRIDICVNRIGYLWNRAAKDHLSSGALRGERRRNAEVAVPRRRGAASFFRVVQGNSSSMHCWLLHLVTDGRQCCWSKITPSLVYLLFWIINYLLWSRTANHYSWLTTESGRRGIGSRLETRRWTTLGSTSAELSTGSGWSPSRWSCGSKVRHISSQSDNS